MQTEMITPPILPWMKFWPILGISVNNGQNQRFGWNEKVKKT